MKLLRFITFILALLIFSFAMVTIISCARVKASSENISRIKVTAVSEKMLADEVSGFGTLGFLTKIDIAAAQDGTIRKIYYREGSVVPKGARIALLSNPQIELAVGRAENAYSQAEAALKLTQSRLMEGEFNAEAVILSIDKAQAEFAQASVVFDEQRRKAESEEKLYEAGGKSDESIRETRFSLASAKEQLSLMERDLEIRSVGLRDIDLKKAGLYPQNGFGSEKERRQALITLSVSTLRAEMQAAKAQVEAAAKELESARIAFSELTIYSPTEGIVGARYLEEGERVNREDKLLTIMDTGSLYVFFPLRERDALRLEKGMTALITVDGAGDTYEGTVDLVSPQADSQSFTFMIRVLLPPSVVSKNPNLKPGMFARALVRLGSERKALLVPESAVVNRKNDSGTVFVINQGKAYGREVQFGNLFDDDMEIISGLKAGEVVAVKPDNRLREGADVIPE